MKANEFFPSRYLKKEDLGDDEITVTLTKVTREEMPGDDVEIRPVLHFRELEKSLVLNVTIKDALVEAFGNETDDWLGKKAVLYVDPEVRYKGKVVGGLRLRPAKAAPRKKTPLVTPTSAAKEERFDDQIP